MSVIGPRPQLVRDMVFMTPEQRMRHAYSYATELDNFVAGQIRLRQWAEQIRDCQNRPEGICQGTRFSPFT